MDHLICPVRQRHPDSACGKPQKPDPQSVQSPWPDSDMAGDERHRGRGRGRGRGGRKHNTENMVNTSQKKL